MTENSYKRSDVPDIDPYTNQPERRLGGTGSPALLYRAQQIGAALGKSVNNLRRTRELLRGISHKTTESVVTCMSELAGAAKTKSQEWSQAAAARASELGEVVAEKIRQSGERTKAGYYRARLRANQISRDHPGHVLAAAGVVGILAGIGIRIWRSNRAH